MRNQALSPYFLVGKLEALLVSLAICLDFWWVVRFLLKDLVSLDLRKMALFPDAL